MRMTGAWAAIGFSIGLVTSPAIAADAGYGARLANACTSCHGLEGRSLGEVPSLAGRHADELIAQLRAFKSGDVEATIMNRLARGYSDEEIVALAAYFSGVAP